LKGESASDHDILPEIKAFIAKARLKRGVEMDRLANRIQALRMQQDNDGDSDDVPESPGTAALGSPNAPPSSSGGARRLSRAARSAIFREVVLAKVRDMRAQEAREAAERTLSNKK